MRNSKNRHLLLGLFLTICIFSLFSCSSPMGSETTRSSSGVSKAKAVVVTDNDGHTVEQRNILEKIKRDNEVGKVRHLYQISSYTGDVLEYHTVKGKITSGGKRLNPEHASGERSDLGDRGFGFDIGPNRYYTLEVLSDDGTYGSSMNYFYFFDTRNEYHQIFPTGGTYVHISDRPLRINKSKLTFAVEE